MTEYPTMNGAESVVRSLHGAGVSVCFANPGTSEMQFVDALDRTGLMRCVLGLFEGVVTGAADGYARMAGVPAVTLLHLAPGLSNASANMHNARKARSPMLNLVGDHAVRHRGYDAPLTSDVAGAAAPFSDWVKTATSPDTFARDAMEALGAAMARPNRVATLIAPADIGWDEGGVVAPPPPPPDCLTPRPCCWGVAACWNSLTPWRSCTGSRIRPAHGCWRRRRTADVTAGRAAPGSTRCPIPSTWRLRRSRRLSARY